MYTTNNPHSLSSDIPTILLVEDEALIALSEARILQSHGYRVQTVHTAQAAIDAAVQPGIDLVLMDIDLGCAETDGTEAAQRILEQREVPIVFLTSHSEQEMVQRVKGITRYGYVLKSSGEFVLVEAITMALELYATHINLTRAKALADETRIQRFEQSLAAGDLAWWEMSLPSGRVVFDNHKADMLGFPPERFQTYQDFMDLVHPDDFEPTMEAMRAHMSGQAKNYITEYRIRTADGLYKWFRDVGKAVQRGSADGSFQILGIVSDISDRKTAEQELRVSEALFSKIFHHAPILMSISNIADGRYEAVNEQFVAATGFAAEQVIGRTSTEIGFITRRDRDAIKDRILGTGRVSDMRLTLRKCNGESLYCLYSGVVIDGHEKQKLLSLAVDITDRVEDERFFETLFNASPDGLVVVNDEGSIELANESYARMTGYSVEELKSMSVIDVDTNPPEETRRLNDTVYEQDGLRLETTNQRKDGTLFPVEVTASRVPGFQRHVSFVRDITARRNMEEKNRRIAQLLASADRLAGVGAAEWDIERDVWEFTDQWKRIHGVTEAPLHTSDLIKLAHPDDMELIQRSLEESAQRNQPYDIEHRIVRPDTGEVRIVRAIGELETSPDTGNPIRLVGAAQDITEYRRAQEQLQQTLTERQHLMMELNHRVKNNLAMVASLVSIKNAELQGQADLSDLEQKIQAIADIHARLQNRESFMVIPLREYLNDICTTALSSCITPVALHNDIGPITLSSRTTTALGLIANELATNAVKHAFSSEAPPEFYLNAYQDKDRCTLSIGNNGKPVPVSIDLNQPETTGLQLVSVLVAQLKGEITLTREPQTMFTIDFLVE